MRIAVLLFDRLTALDAVGPAEVLARLPGAEVVFTGERTGPVQCEGTGLTLTADAALSDVPDPDLVLVPGGPGQAALMGDGPVHEWLRAVAPGCTWVASVCTGSLILAAAGLLTGRHATTHWLAMDQLAPLGAIPVAERVVADGRFVSAAGVSAGLDLALTLAGRIAGEGHAQSVQLALEYDPQPPFDAGSPERAPAAVVAALRAAKQHILLG